MGNVYIITLKSICFKLTFPTDQLVNLFTFRNESTDEDESEYKSLDSEQC